MTTHRRGIIYKSLTSRLVPSAITARRASRNYSLNTQNSLLYTLPYELIQYIGTFLDYADRFCFALSSYKYADALLSIRDLGVEELLVKEVTCRQNRDHFYGRDHCLFSWLGRGVGQMYCVGCSRQHNLYRFPNDTTAQPQHLRKCFRTIDGPFQVCPHNEFTFLELANILRKHKRKGRQNKHGHFFHCMECYENSYGRNGTGRCTHPPTLSFVPKTSTVTLLARFVLLSTPWTEPISIQQTHDALALLDLQICPHMNTSDTTTIDSILGGRGETILEGRFSKRVSIECNNCQTIFSVKRRIPYREIVVEVERRLGRLKWEGDPMWRAHLPRREGRVP